MEKSQNVRLDRRRTARVDSFDSANFWAVCMKSLLQDAHCLGPAQASHRTSAQNRRASSSTVSVLLSHREARSAAVAL